MDIKNNCKLIKRIFKTTKNPFDVLLYRAGIKNHLIIKTKGYGTFNIPEGYDNSFVFNLIYSYIVNIPENIKPTSEETLEFETFIQNVLNDENKTINVNGINFLNNKTVSVLSERFTDKYSIQLDVEGKVVLDLGANILDTALGFVQRGAKKVYSYEALPSTYKIAQDNLALNKQYADKIMLFNKAISKDEIFEIPDEDEVFSAVASSYNSKANKKVYKIETITVNQIIDMIPEQAKLMKMDIEGSEFELIDDTHWDYFDELLIEYHSFLTGKSYTIITDKLKQLNFNVEVIPTSYYDIEDVGLIHATKK